MKRYPSIKTKTICFFTLASYMDAAYMSIWWLIRQWLVNKKTSNHPNEDCPIRCNIVFGTSITVYSPRKCANTVYWDLVFYFGVWMCCRLVSMIAVVEKLKASLSVRLEVDTHWSLTWVLEVSANRNVLHLNGTAVAKTRSDWMSRIFKANPCMADFSFLWVIGCI